MWKANAASVPRSEKILRRASCTASESVGDCVRINGPKVGTLYDVVKMDPQETGTTPAVGVITKKYDTTICQVLFHGPAKNVFSSLTPGTVYWVGKDSTPKSTPQSPDPGKILYHQCIGIAIDDEEMLVNPQMPVKRHSG